MHIHHVLGGCRVDEVYFFIRRTASTRAYQCLSPCDRITTEDVQVDITGWSDIAIEQREAREGRSRGDHETRNARDALPGRTEGISRIVHYCSRIRARRYQTASRCRERTGKSEAHGIVNRTTVAGHLRRSDESHWTNHHWNPDIVSAVRPGQLPARVVVEGARVPREAHVE